MSDGHGDLDSDEAYDLYAAACWCERIDIPLDLRSYCPYQHFCRRIEELEAENLRLRTGRLRRENNSE